MKTKKKYKLNRPVWWRNKRTIHIPIDLESFVEIKKLGEKHDLPTVTVARKLLKYTLNLLKEGEKIEIKNDKGGETNEQIQNR
ncbi:MAG: hypothetical protein NC918_02605 [Candidatus Omnitrophica bacterium]|nr:hypothetical protein [Candidatus Omnitrophota bacterium]